MTTEATYSELWGEAKPDEGLISTERTRKSGFQIFYGIPVASTERKFNFIYVCDSTQGQPTQEQMLLRRSAGGSLDENMNAALLVVECGVLEGRTWEV